jgi:uncharacterized protein (DUF433 family)
MNKKYVEYRNECYWIEGTRVSLDSIVYAFRQGLSPETIAAECFSTLTLEQVYGAISFYLANRKIIDAYLEQGEALYEELREKSREADPAFYRKFMTAHRQANVANA